jgi:hypothetical protein
VLSKERGVMVRRIGMIALSLGLFGLCSNAQALPLIFGEIQFTGSLDTIPGSGTLLTATGINFLSGEVDAIGGSPSGAYAGIPDTTPVTFTDFSFNPFVAPSPNLWEFTYLGTHYSFALESAQVSQFTVFGLNFFVLVGNGVAHIDDGLGTDFYQPTPGTFSLSTQGNGDGTFSYSAQTDVVPEPGTLLLIGSGLTALALRRRRRG